MAYPTSRTRAVVARSFTNADSTVVRLRSLAVALDAQMAATAVTATVILDELLAELRSSRAVLIVSRDTPGILPYAQAQLDDPTVDLPTEFAVLINAVDATIAWIVNNFPKSPGDWLEQFKLAADGTKTDRMFPPAQTVGLRAQLQAIVSAVE